MIFDKVTTDLRTSIPIAKAAMMRTTPATLATVTTAQVFTPESSDSSRFRAAVGIKHDVSYTSVSEFSQHRARRRFRMSRARLDVFLCINEEKRIWHIFTIFVFE